MQIKGQVSYFNVNIDRIEKYILDVGVAIMNDCVCYDNMYIVNLGTEFKVSS